MIHGRWRLIYRLKQIIKFFIIMVILLFLFVVSWRLYPYFYMKFMSLEKVKIGKEEYSSDKKFKAVKYQIPRIMMDSIFTRLTNVKTGEVLANIELDETLYYEFRDNKYCLGYTLHYRLNWFYNNVEDNDVIQCIDLK